MASIEIHEVFEDQFDPSDSQELEVRDALIAAFEFWAVNGYHPDFGKDVSYRDPEGSVVPQVGLRHVHLRPLEMTAEKSKSWNDPTLDPYRKTSDRHLVYVRSDEHDRLLLFYFEEDAHALGRLENYKFLKALGRAAQEWLKDNSLYPDLND